MIASIPSDRADSAPDPGKPGPKLVALALRGAWTRLKTWTLASRRVAPPTLQTILCDSSSHRLGSTGVLLLRRSRSCAPLSAPVCASPASCRYSLSSVDAVRCPSSSAAQLSSGEEFQVPQPTSLELDSAFARLALDDVDAPLPAQAPSPVRSPPRSSERVQASTKYGAYGPFARELNRAACRELLAALHCASLVDTRV